jgi:hypothetical protein
VTFGAVLVKVSTVLEGHGHGALVPADVDASEVHEQGRLLEAGLPQDRGRVLAGDLLGGLVPVDDLAVLVDPDNGVLDLVEDAVEEVLRRVLEDVEDVLFGHGLSFFSPF